MDKLKVMTVIGTRPDIIKLSQVMIRCDEYFEHILVHTGQNWDYTLNEVFFSDLGIRKPDYYLDSVGSNLGETLGNIINKSYELLSKVMPDALLILGDTNSSLCVICAKRLKIPVFHMEAGNRCFDQNLPEELNRKIVDSISDVNLPYSEHARRYLISEGFRKEHIYVTGSPMAEVLDKHKKDIEISQVLDSLDLKSNEYILLSAHREENIDNEKNFMELMNSINHAAETYNIPVIYSMHPRSKKYIEKRGFKFHPLVRSLEPFGFFDYCKLQLNSFCVISDSGTLAEECSLLNFPAVSLRTSTERPEAFDKGNLIIGGIDKKSVIQSIDLCVSMNANKHSGIDVPAYMDKNVSTKVVKIIQSYTGIINKVIWNKPT